MNNRVKEVLAFVNNKGGVAKTTTVQNVAAGLLRHNKRFRILCIDLDPQGNLSGLMGWGSKRKEVPTATTMYEAMRDGFDAALPVYKCREGLYYCPASPRLATIEPDLHRQMNPKLVLNQLLGHPYKNMEDGTQGSVIADFDYILIDCAPALSEITYNALGCATGVIIPMSLDSLSVSGLPPMLDACKLVYQQLNPNLELRGILITMADERTNFSKTVTEYVRGEYDVFKSRIRQCIKVKEAQGMKQDIFEYAPYCTAGLDYAAFVKELIDTYSEE